MRRDAILERWSLIRTVLWCMYDGDLLHHRANCIPWQLIFIVSAAVQLLIITNLLPTIQLFSLYAYVLSRSFLGSSTNVLP